MTELAGKIALVTGAASGIGRAAAVGLASRGAVVAVVDRDEAGAAETVAAITGAGGRAAAFVADIVDEESVRAVIAAAVQSFGRLDMAINSAGVPSTGHDLIAMSADSWERVLRINLTGTFFCVKHETTAMLDTGGGAIVNIASNGGLYAIPNAPAYVASKHGVIGLTKAAAVDYGRHGIRVNAVAPSITRTAMFDHVAGDSNMAAQQEAVTPLGRLATPEEIAAAAIWLASDDASYVTGTTLSVDGGRRA